MGGTRHGGATSPTESDTAMRRTGSPTTRSTSGQRGLDLRVKNA